ncbi:MAG: class I SAM-dependent methyltransferase, partial [Deltaproteobacteria bacterium]|nr:class I SAM-dependent methyltransferase [Deltaproteobacteria bacterium]
QMIVLIPASVIVLMPFIRPLRISLLFWTYIIPLLPFIITYDGVISSLRTYTAEELRDFTEKVTHDSYVWQTGRQPVPHIPRSVTYLIGYPLTK